ncbi:MAG: hypothetical protein HY319_26660 [Armatimonadetes bacterium]|nr:hypothetical protein [Armatimonadota bacterium]
MTPTSIRPLPAPAGAAEARQKVEQALTLVGEARQENGALPDVFEEARAGLAGYEPHLQAIKFDRPDRDVSDHGRSLRQQAASASQDIQEGQPGQDRLEDLSAQVADLIDGAIQDLGGGNSTARWRLTSAKNDVGFALESSIPVTGISLRHASKAITESLDPYLVEVEEDAPGRDVGRFAEDIEELWLTAEEHLQVGPIYVRSTERSLESAQAYLELARQAL